MEYARRMKRGLHFMHKRPSITYSKCANQEGGSTQPLTPQKTTNA